MDSSATSGAHSILNPIRWFRVAPPRASFGPSLWLCFRFHHKPESTLFLRGESLVFETPSICDCIAGLLVRATG